MLNGFFEDEGVRVWLPRQGVQMSTVLIHRALGHTHILRDNDCVLWLRQLDVGTETLPNLGNVAYAQAAHCPENVTKMNPTAGCPSPVFWTYGATETVI